MPTEPTPHRAGYIAIVGRPNVGKSTLMNALIGERLSIVTHRPQTTRQRVIGILSRPAYQAVFMDTPGLLDPAYTLHEMMVHAAVQTIRAADVTIAMIDATQSLKDLNRSIVDRLKQSRGPVLLAINKIDRIKKPALLPLIEEAIRRFPFSHVVPVSALLSEGLEELLNAAVQALPEGPALYPPDMLTDRPERFFAGEIIREQVFLRLGDELPYASAVLIEDFKDRENGTAYIQASILLERDSQKGIVIGKQGVMLKRIGTAAREALIEFLGRPVYLDLWVKVRPGWRKNEKELKRLGYERER